MQYLIKCCNRIVDLDNKPKWCIKCGLHNIDVIEFTSDTMLPCPFCGGSPTAECLSSIPMYWYECDECMASSGSGSDWAEARENWNKRK